MIISERKHSALLKEREQINQDLKELAIEMQNALKLGDLSENEEYHDAKRNIAKLRRRLSEIDEVINNAEVQHSDASSRWITIDSFVKVTNKTKNLEPRILRVDGIGATLGTKPEDCVLGVKSPLGSVILNSLGGTFKVSTPNGIIEYEVEKVPEPES